MGHPKNETEASACAAFIECRWWNASGAGRWSGEGCETLGSANDDDGVFMCSCDHLTDFVVFEFPQTPQQLLNDVSNAAALNGFSAATLACIATPSPSKIPIVYLIDGVLLVGGLAALAWAARRDEEEVNPPLLVAAAASCLLSAFRCGCHPSDAEGR